MGTKNATSTATTTLPSWVQSAYQNVLGQAGQTASQPYTPYTGGFTPAQQTGVSNLTNLQGAGNSNFQQANGAVNSALTPSYQTVGNYMSPYIGSVVNATMQNMQEQNAQQQQGVIGNAITKGAYGGNRVGVAQGELARQQGLANNQTIAGLYNDAYQQALTANQGQQQLGLQGAQTLGQLGQTQSETGINQANALFGAGTQQQGFDYSQYLNQQGFPYQQAAYLSSIVGGLGPSAGGTTTESKPQGNIISELLGAVLGGASLFGGGGGGGSNAGGRVPAYAGGGGVGGNQFPTISPDDQKQGPDIADIAKIAMMFAHNGGVVHRAGGGGVMPYANNNSPWGPINMGGTPYANDNSGFASYIPQVAMGGGGGNFPTISPDEQQPDPLSQYSDVMKKGAGNIKDWLTGPKPMDLGLAGGGVVSKWHYPEAQWSDANHHARPFLRSQDEPGNISKAGWHYSGLSDLMKNLSGSDFQWRGRPESTNVEDRTGGFSRGQGSVGVLPYDHFSRQGYALGGSPDKRKVKTSPETSDYFNPTTPFYSNTPTLTADDLTAYAQKHSPTGAIDAAAGPSTDATNPLSTNDLGISFDGKSVGNTGNAGAVVTADDTGPQMVADAGSGVIPAPTYGTAPQAPPSSTGAVPYSTGPQFTTTPTPGFSKNVGDAWSSLTAGKGLNLSPDMQQSLLAAGLGMMSSKSPFALQGIGEGGLKGVETWFARQNLEKELAAQRGSNAQSGSDVAANLAAAANTQMQTANAATTLTPSPAGMVQTAIGPDGQKKPSLIPFSSIPVQGGAPATSTPYANGAAPGAGTTVSKTFEATQAPVVAQGDLPDQMWFPDGYSNLVSTGDQQFIAPATQAATAARQLDTSLGQMSSLVDQMPDTGPLVMGADFEGRLGFVKGVNTYLTALGAQPIAPQDVATSEGLRKLGTQLNFAAANQATTDPGLGVITQAAAASPSGDNTKQGYAHITSYLMAINKRAEDRSDYFNDWSARNKGVMITKSGSADKAFNASNPPQKYVAMGDAIQKALLNQQITQSEFDLLPPDLKARYAPVGG